MALKYKITKSAFDKLGEEHQELYVEKDGGYVLDVTGVEDPAELRRARDREKETAREARERADAAEAELEELKSSANRKSGDIDSLEKSWQAKLEKANADHEAETTSLRNSISKLLVDNKASEVAHKISTVPSLMAKAIGDRLTVDFEGDEPKTIVLGPDGKPSAMTIDDLSQEFVANEDYANIIVGSKASGSGADRSANRPGGAEGERRPENYDPSKMPAKDLAENIKARKEAANT